MVEPTSIGPEWVCLQCARRFDMTPDGPVLVTDLARVRDDRSRRGPGLPERGPTPMQPDHARLIVAELRAGPRPYNALCAAVGLPKGGRFAKTLQSLIAAGRVVKGARGYELAKRVTRRQSA